MSEKPTYEELEQKVSELKSAESEYKRIIEEQQQKEKRYQNLFENMLHEVHVWELVRDETGNIMTWKLVDANPVALKFWNKGLSEVVGKTPDEMFPGSGATKQFMPIVEKIFSEGTTHIWEEYFPNTDQTLHMVSIPLGEYFISTGLDITKRRQAEKTLRQKHEMLKRTEAIAHVGSWEWEIETDKVTWSEELYHIFQLDPDVEAPNWTEHPKLLHPQDFKKLRQLVETALTEGKPYEIELRAFRKDGETRICVAKGFPETGQGGKVVRLVGFFQDITERKKSEIELQKSRDYIYEITNSIGDIVLSVRLPERKIEWVNNSIRSIGYEPSECIGESTYLFYQDEKAFLNFGNVLNEAITEGKNIFHTENVLKRKNGESFPAEITVSFYKVNNEIVSVIAILRDITEKKQLQTKLNQAQKMESVGRLAGGVAHDFNNMLGVILGHTELALLQADENHELYSDLKEIQTAAMRSADITKQLLAFARKQTISPRQLDLNNTVESMLNMLRRLIGEDIDLVWKPAAYIWPVKMDPSQIDQILANLCINARDAISGIGKLTIETGKKTFDEKYCKDNPDFIPGDFSMLAVSDNGCGMDKTTLKNLFEPFYTTKDVGKGTGLGLSTVYGIVKQNNGFINVYSEPGQGSTFKIYLSRLVVNENIDKVVPDKKVTAGGTETILLVEDEPSILRMTRMMLERKGYTVLTATTPADAMKKAKSHSDSIDLLMTDVVMPGMNGRDLAGQISTLYPDIGLLFMSGYTADVIAHQGVLDAGVAFIQKPFSLADMTEKVRNILDMAPDKNQG